jgi:hypothetical protein
MGNLPMLRQSCIVLQGKRKKERNGSKGMSAAISEVPRRRGRRD